MKDKEKSEDGKFIKLRSNAETVLKATAHKVIGGEKDIKSIFQELQIHQIELEMQNDELRIANEELELQRIKFTGIYDLAPVGYFILDKTGIIEEVNTAGLQLLEMHKAEVIDRRLYSFVAKNFSDIYYLFYRRLLTSSEKQTCQLKFISRSGREFFALVEGIIVKSTSQCYITVMDTTEVIGVRQKLAESNERLALALEASLAGTWELRLPGMEFYLDKFNYQADNTKWDKFENTYRSFIDMVHPDDRFMVDQHFRTAINTGKEVDLVCRFPCADGTVCYANMRGHGTERGSEGSYIGIIMDITEKRRIEEEAAILKQDQQKAITTATLNAQENERKRISEALHDSVSQLLYGIRLQLGQLDIENKVKATRHLNELLDMAIQETRNISFELTPSILTDFGLSAAIQELVERLSSPGLKIKIKVSGFTERADLQLETGIFRIVQELINNCMKHSAASLVQVNIQKNKTIKIEVIDNGRGFDAKQLESKPKGAGFSSIKNRISLYNGNLQIDSSPGKGTSVRIELHL